MVCLLTFTCFEVSLTKRGLKRVLGSATPPKHLITPKILIAIHHSLDMTSLSQAMMWALFMVAFFSFLHKSNLVSPTTSKTDCERHLTRSDIKFTTAGCFLRIKWSKSPQHKEGIHVVPLPSIPHSPLCPVTAIHQYLSLVPANPDNPFFCFPTATRLTTTSFFTTTLKRLISKIGLTPANYSPHSLKTRWCNFCVPIGGSRTSAPTAQGLPL